MNDYGSLSHTRWECKYHIVFTVICDYIRHQEKEDKRMDQLRLL